MWESLDARLEQMRQEARDKTFEGAREPYSWSIDDVLPKNTPPWPMRQREYEMRNNYRILKQFLKTDPSTRRVILIDKVVHAHPTCNSVPDDLYFNDIRESGGITTVYCAGTTGVRLGDLVVVEKCTQATFGQCWFRIEKENE